MVERFVPSWIKDVLWPVGLSRVFIVERAHRALVAPPHPGAPPRAIIARLLNYAVPGTPEGAIQGEIPLFQREKVWRWLETWDKVAPGRPARTGLAVHGPSGVASPD
ncbi:hypothetical protein NDU88_010891 [Pleurodeles waltl]|uniref:Uncharacterized protein n=1 Tax=Pleurodeles waltl TaxID=8319 RepID=A0AAV7S2I2_PLEWA|nr:hypothetical protein NDU88_010891 [Pleurodeles waltl]